MGRARNNIFFCAGVEMALRGRAGGLVGDGGWASLPYCEFCTAVRRGLPLCASSAAENFLLLSSERRFFGGLFSAAGEVLRFVGRNVRRACYIPSPSFFARASARSRTAFSARSISAFRAAMFSFAIFERSASVYKNAPSKLPHIGSIL